ncbi:MAG: hypothetical protein D6759_11090, partial [Chloroflexi bacterium]
LEVSGRLAVLPATQADVGPDAGKIGPAADAPVTFTFTFTNAYDGSSQEAMAQLPAGYDGSTPVPLLVFAHARSSSMADGISTFGDATNTKGWLLVSPEMHGSWTGYPQPEDIGKPPGAYAYASLESQYDIIGAMSYMIDHYNVMTDRIYLVGYSMGGQIATVTMGKFPHIFAAVFDNKGATNMVDWYYESTSYHQRWMRRECHINEVEQDPTQNPFCYQRRSSINFANNYIHIPISITHSVSDTLVPIHHSRDFRDAINSYGPDRLVVIYEDTVVGPTCDDNGHYHCYEPDPMDVLNFLEQFTLNPIPSHINITSDESKDYYWLRLAQTGGDHWSQVEATAYPSATITALISDTRPLTVAFNLGSTPVRSKAVTPKMKQPGLGLPSTTYLIRGGGVYTLKDYTSGYFTVSLAMTGQFTLTLSAIDLVLSADPAMIPGGGTATSTITAAVRDQMGTPVPDGTLLRLTTTEGTFPNGSKTYTTTLTGGWATTTLTLGPTADLAKITGKVGMVTGTASVDAIYPALDLKTAPDATMIYVGESVTFTYRLTNTGDVTLTQVAVVDDNGTPGEPGDDLTVCAGLTLPAGATAQCARSAVLDDDFAGSATASGQDPLGHPVSDTGSAAVTVISPALAATVVPTPALVYSGSRVTFTYRLTNTGDVTLTQVAVVDDNGTPGEPGDDLTVCAGLTLPAGATAQCARSLVVTMAITSSATVAGLDPLGHRTVVSIPTVVSVMPPLIILYVPFVVKGSP